jgi:hypothetical protein
MARTPAVDCNWDLESRELEHKKLEHKKLEDMKLEDMKLENRELENRELENRELENREPENREGMNKVPDLVVYKAHEELGQVHMDLGLIQLGQGRSSGNFAVMNHPEKTPDLRAL